MFYSLSFIGGTEDEGFTARVRRVQRISQTQLMGTVDTEFELQQNTHWFIGLIVCRRVCVGGRGDYLLCHRKEL